MDFAGSIFNRSPLDLTQHSSSRKYMQNRNVSIHSFFLIFSLLTRYLPPSTALAATSDGKYVHATATKHFYFLYYFTDLICKVPVGLNPAF